MSADINRAPFEASDIALFRSILVSRRLAAGAPASLSYGILSPPAVMRTLYDSCFRGLWSHANDAYVMAFSFGA